MRQTMLVTVSLLAAAARLPAQSTEIGFDGSAEFRIDDNDGDKYTQISIGGGGFLPASAFRVAFPVGQFKLEPALGYARYKEGDFDFSMLQAVVGLLFERSAPSGGSNLYFRPFGTFDLIDANDVSSSSQFGLGAGLGVRFPMDDRLSVRLEGNFTHRFENDDFTNRNTLGVRLGFSMMLKPKA